MSNYDTYNDKIVEPQAIYAESVFVESGSPPPSRSRNNAAITPIISDHNVANRYSPSKDNRCNPSTSNHSDPWTTNHNNPSEIERNLFSDGQRRPVRLSMCPRCTKKDIKTKTKTFPTGPTWAAVAVGAVVFFPLCWIPLVGDSMKQTNHYCQNCGCKIGRVRALEGCFVKERM